MSAPSDLNRRVFVGTAAGGGAALVLGVYLGKTRAQGSAPSFAPNAWIRITPDSRITVLVEVPEMGQGPRTAIPMLLAEELEADWSAIRVEQAPTLPQIYKKLSTGGSGAVEWSWDTMRKAGAQAREMLLAAAANQWNVDKRYCHAQNGTVVHVPTGRSVPYGALVETASKLPAIDPGQIALKPPQQFRVIGKSFPRTDVPDKIDGAAKFGIDVRVPGMLFAVIARCPHFGGRLLNFDATAAKTVPGVRAVFAIPPVGFVPSISRNVNTAGGVAVVANSTWAAIEGRKALQVAWDRGPGGGENTAGLQAALHDAAAGPPSMTARTDGDVSGALETAAHKVDATYELPFQAHATMEPMNTTLHVRDDGIEVWSPTQIAAKTQSEVAQLANIPAENVTVHMTLSGGSFGRRYQWDFIAEAWQVGNQVRQPVQLLWTREDDMRHDFYRPASYHRLTGGLDDRGRIVAWSHRIVSTPIRQVFDSPESLQDPRNVASQELDGAGVLPYGSANFRLDYAPASSVVPRAWWRSVASSFTAFAMECFVDELAHAAGRDPYEFRMSLLPGDEEPPAPKDGEDRPLDKRRFRAVLQLAAEKAGWAHPMPAGSGRGLACHYSFNTYIAHVAEVDVDSAGKLRVRRIVSAVDCGTAVNPDGVRAMTEGAINYALTPVLAGEITIEDGAVMQSNFHDYSVLRMADAPEIEVHIVPSTDRPGGMGEPGVPPLAPAVANAYFAATGKRLRRLPVLPNS